MTEEEQIDQVKTIIQGFFDQNTLIFVGSGLSAAEGIPGMAELAEMLLNEIPSRIESQSEELKEKWKKIAEKLEEGMDLENVLLQTSDITESLVKLIKNAIAIDIYKAEQEVVRQIKEGKRTLRFSKFISKFSLPKGQGQGLPIITTNYDRLIEYACELSNISLDNLFIGRYISHFSPDNSKYRFCKKVYSQGKTSRIEYEPHVIIHKPHGSLDWYLIDGIPYSLPQQFSPECLIIPPGTSKFQAGYNVPYDKHRELANRAIDNAARYIIIGYGFNDSHLQVHLESEIQKKSALIITKDLNQKIRELAKNNPNITTLSSHIMSNEKCGTEIQTRSNCIFTQCNLWDIEKMVQEVFNE